MTVLAWPYYVKRRLLRGKTEAQKMAANCDLSCFQEQAHLFGLIKLQNKTFGLELRELYTFTL